MAHAGAQSDRLGSRHALARSWAVEGFQGSLWLAAFGPLGIGERRQSRQSTAVRRHAGGRSGEGEERNRRTGSSPGTGLTPEPVGRVGWSRRRFATVDILLMERAGFLAKPGLIRGEDATLHSWPCALP